MPIVSVIIPCRNEEKRISALLDALYSQSYATDEMEVVIADGMSTDATRELIADFARDHADLKIRVVDNPKQIIPAALNVAIEAASGDFIVRMDAHSVPDVDYVKNSVDDLVNGKGENVGGVWKIQPGEDTWVAKSIVEATSHPLGVGGAKYRYTTEAEEVDTVPFGAFRKDLIDEIGGFDESLLTNEDYEFNVRIRQNGGRIWLNPAIFCKYYARESFGLLAKQYWRYGYWKAKMLKRYPETARPRQILPPLFVLGVVGLIGLSFVSNLFLWALCFILLFYLLVLISVGTTVAFKKNYFPYVVGMPMAIILMHFVWGSAFWVGLVTRK